MKLRVGRKVGRTIYLQRGDQPSDDDQLVGLMDTPELARHLVECSNHLKQPISEVLRMTEFSDRPVEDRDIIPCPEGCLRAERHRHLRDGTVQVAYRGLGVTEALEIVFGPPMAS